MQQGSAIDSPDDYQTERDISDYFERINWIWSYLRFILAFICPLGRVVEVLRQTAQKESSLAYV